MVTRCEAEDIVSSYSDSHSVYDSYSNVWDACKYFGEQSNNDDNIGNDDSVVLTPSGTPADDNGTLEQAEHEAFLRDRVCQLNAAPPSEWFKKLVLSYSLDTRSKLNLTQDTFDILGYLVFHYGFVPPLPLQSKSPVNPKDWETNIKNIGLDIHKNPPLADFSEPIVSFLKGFLWAAGPSQELWDLHLGN